MKKRIIAIIQARTGSTRLPAKVLKPILGQPMIIRMLERVKRARSLDAIIIATSDNKEDEALEEIAKVAGVGCFRGSKNDVLDRYYQAGKSVGLAQEDVIICLMGDCTLHDPDVIEEGIRHFLDAKDPLAYAGTVLNYPEGLDFNVFTFGALEEAWKNAKLPSEREHIARYFINHPERFRAVTWTTGTRDDSKMHWSVDTAADFEFVSKIFEELYPINPAFGKDDVLALLDKRAELLNINKGGTGYEGLAKSLKEDEEFKKNLK